MLYDLIFGTIGLFVSSLVVHNYWRQRFHWHGELKANCLLTRHSVVFIAGPRSLIYFKNYYNFLPSFLAEHGYSIFHLHLPWKQQRLEYFTRFLKMAQSQNQKYHFIGHPEVTKELQSALDTYPDVALSLTPYQYSPQKDHPSQSLWLNLLQSFHSWLSGSKILLSELGPYNLSTPAEFISLIDKLTVLAETDFIEGTKNERRHQQPEK
ncbi:MAG: hypothetical protein ACLGGX_08930 [Bdellovibrionia bacterium]